MQFDKYVVNENLKYVDQDSNEYAFIKYMLYLYQNGEKGKANILYILHYSVTPFIKFILKFIIGYALLLLFVGILNHFFGNEIVNFLLEHNIIK